MDVSAWSNGAKTFGIRVGARNRTRYFDQSWSEIEVEIDGELHSFDLTAGFWNDCPEFRDRGTPVIREWLERSNLMDWPRGQPPRFRLQQLSGNRFRLTS